MERVSSKQARLAELTRAELERSQQHLNQSLEQFKRHYDDTWERVRESKSTQQHHHQH
jgi:hypothetical protein